MADTPIVVKTATVFRSFISGTVPQSLLRGQEFVNVADGFRLIGDGETDPADLPKIAFLPAAQMPLSVAQAQALAGKMQRGRRAVQDQALTALPTDTFIGLATLTAPRTVTLPAAASYPPGQTLYIADESGSCSPSLLITITAAGADSIAGQPSVTMGSPYQKLAFHSNGSNLWTVA